MRIYSLLVIIVFLLSSCSKTKPALEQSEENRAYLSIELDKSFLHYELQYYKIKKEIDINQFDLFNNVKKTEKTLSEAQILLSEIESYNHELINSDIETLSDISLIKKIKEHFRKYNYKDIDLSNENIISDKNYLKYLLVFHTRSQISCLYGKRATSMSLGRNNIKPLSKEIDSLNTNLSEGKDFNENVFIPSNLLDNISISPIILDNDSYNEFGESALVGETSTWLHTEEMVNNFSVFKPKKDSLTINHYLQVCPWNNKNHLLLVNISFHREMDVKDLTLKLNPKSVNEYRLLGYENHDEEFAKDFREGKAVRFWGRSGFTMFYEINLHSKTVETIAEIILNIENRDEKRIIQYNKVIDSVDKIPLDEFTFLAGVVEVTLVLNNSKYKGEASLQAVEKRLSKINDITENQERFLKLLNFYIDAESTQPL